MAPFPGSASEKLTAGVAVPAAPTAPVEIARMTIPGGNVAKLIVMTVELTAADVGDTVTFHLYRDGAEIAATDVYDIDVAITETLTLTVHWHDDDPGPGSIVYSVRADSVNGDVTAGSRRGTAMQAA